METTVCEVKNTLDRINRLYIKEEKSSEHEDTATETNQNETQRQKKFLKSEKSVCEFFK